MVRRADREVSILDPSGIAPVSTSAEEQARALVATRLREQAIGCDLGNSPLYEHLLNRSAEDVEAGGPVWAVLRGRADDPAGSALSLRFMAAVHRLVLEGGAPKLAALYPSVGGTGDPEGAWPAFRSTMEIEGDALSRLIELPCQTNEVGRSAALLGGFLLVARETGLPLRLLELGACAGLNLRWDHYRYEGAGAAWGDAQSPVRLLDMFESPVPPLDGHPVVIERRGCDLSPLDPGNELDRLRLRSSIWADQVDRFRTLDGALEVAGRVPAEVDRGSAPDWLEEQLTHPSTGTATVVFHSVLLQYLSDRERDRLIGTLQAKGQSADSRSPLAWLRMEPKDWRRREPHRVRLTTWPGGEERVLARSGAHGRPVWWTSNDPGSGRGPSAGPILAS